MSFALSVLPNGAAHAPAGTATIAPGGWTGASVTWTPGVAWGMGVSEPAASVPLRLAALLQPTGAAPGAPPDMTFPVDLDLSSPFVRFHLLAWRDGQGQFDPDRFWAVASGGQTLEGRLMFRERALRRAFLRWWQGCARRHFAGTPPARAYLPRLRQGRVSGTFVPFGTALDLIPDAALAEGRGRWAWDNAQLADGLVQVLPAWSWIAANCRKAVWRQPGGWLFGSAAEAAAFRLFHPDPAAGALDP